MLKSFSRFRLFILQSHLTRKQISPYRSNMVTVRDGHKIIFEAELALRKLIERGLQEQRYSEIAEIANLVQGLVKLLQPNGAPPSPAPTAARSREALQSGRHSGKRDEYPRFERDEERLTKVGWSKRKKEPYEHRAPRSAVVSVARRISSIPEGKVFLMESLLPITDVTTGTELPAYQIYLTLAWLRTRGAIRKKGRDGYILKAGALSDDVLQNLWERTPARSSSAAGA